MVLDPDDGAMACGEYGPGRLPDPEAIWAQIEALFTGPDALPIQAPVEPPKQGGIAPGSLYEALEPEDEGDYEAEGAPSLSLSASMIARSGTGRAPSLDDDPPEGWVPQSPFADIAEPADLSAGGPIMAQKGAAKAAPPTDPQALNHMVSARQSAPEPLAGDAHPVAVEPELPADGPLSGKHILVTAGPTHEPIDPVRYIANRSSGKQGYAIAEAAARLGARVTLVSGPVNLPTPRGVDRIDVETAQQMADAVKHALPADCAVMVAAVADWRTKDVSAGKMKKRGSAPPVLMLTENPDILASVAAGTRKPALLVGFAAETDDVLKYASEKRLRKGADWIVANDVSQDVMGAETNQVHIVTKDGVESLPLMAKGDVAMAIVERIADALVPAED
jgi:phosphopantothenoylcysteine decarboxylase/phosphopantothenate--cysteine ligase